MRSTAAESTAPDVGAGWVCGITELYWGGIGIYWDLFIGIYWGGIGIYWDYWGV
jgi:hypothetical protein